VKEVMGRLTDGVEAVAVVEDGTAIGRVDRAQVLARLLDPRGV